MDRFEMMEELERRFQLTVVPVSEFYGTVDDGVGIWVRNSEDAVAIVGSYPVPLFNYYALSDDYICGVWVDLHNFLSDNGYYAEAHDSGTYMIYQV